MIKMLGLMWFVDLLLQIQNHITQFANTVHTQSF